MSTLPSRAYSQSRPSTSLFKTLHSLPATDNVGPHSPDTLFRFQPHPTVQKDFVQTIRAVEDILESTPDLASSGNITETFLKATEAGSCSDAIKPVLVDSAPVLSEMVLRYGGQDMIDGFKQPRNEPLTTKYAYLFSARLIFRTERQYFLVASWT